MVLGADLRGVRHVLPVGFACIFQADAAFSSRALFAGEVGLGQRGADFLAQGAQLRGRAGVVLVPARRIALGDFRLLQLDVLRRRGVAARLSGKRGAKQRRADDEVLEVSHDVLRCRYSLPVSSMISKIATTSPVMPLGA